MILSDFVTIALSFSMIIFPTFVIIPSAFSIYRRNPGRLYFVLYDISFVIAGFILFIATIYAGIGLFGSRSIAGFILGILISLITLSVLFFLYKLVAWLWELTLLQEYRKAQTTE